MLSITSVFAAKPQKVSKIAYLTSRGGGVIGGGGGGANVGRVSVGGGGLLVPKSEGQQRYMDLLNHKNVSILIGLGPAGTGKTLFSCHAAVNGLLTGAYQKIVLTRPVVSVEEELGFLPGSLVQKMDPWTRPVFDIFLERFSKVKLDSMIQNGVIEISPLGYMRGRTFKNTFIIADEMQNSSPMQMKMMTTRMGEGSKMVITGDLNQSDRCEKNGLVDLVDRLRRGSGGETGLIRMVELSNSDVQRSAVVREVLDLYGDGDLGGGHTVNFSGVGSVGGGDGHTGKFVAEDMGCYGDAAMIPKSQYK
jgi:phosphate starvation-inducible PhoH-like protein